MIRAGRLPGDELALVRVTSGSPWRQWHREQELFELMDRENRAREELEAFRLQRQQEPEPKTSRPEVSQPVEDEPKKPARRKPKPKPKPMVAGTWAERMFLLEEARSKSREE